MSALNVQILLQTRRTYFILLSHSCNGIGAGSLCLLLPLQHNRSCGRRHAVPPWCHQSSRVGQLWLPGPKFPICKSKWKRECTASESSFPRHCELSAPSHIFIIVALWAPLPWFCCRLAKIQFLQSSRQFANQCFLSWNCLQFRPIILQTPPFINFKDLIHRNEHCTSVFS